MSLDPNKPRACQECDGDGYIRTDEERPVRWRWREAEGYNLSNTETCPRCNGDGYEPEDKEPDEEV